MGYELHITRKPHWLDDGADISEDEWQRCVSADPEMRMTGFAQATTPSGEAIRYDSPLLAEWSMKISGSPIWFDFRNGQVIVNNPDAEVIAKMVKIARSLRARVQGDDGEFYDG
jgi:hypothetical protein